MIQKIKQELKNFFKSPKDVISFFIPIILAIILVIPVPYTVTVGGGTLNIDSKIEIEDENKKTGSFNAAYVKELKGNVLTYLMSKVVKSYKLNKIEEITLEHEEIKDYNFREKMYFNTSVDSATLVAYKALGKEISIKDIKIYVIYIDPSSDTTLQVQDMILEVNNIKVKTVDEINNIIKNTDSDEIKLKVLRNNKEIDVVSKMMEINNEKKLGVYLISEYTYETPKEMEFNFSKKEVGPSGGLMMALSIYNKLSNEDITKGKTIVGTGTIDDLGNVGEIGGVSYKLKGAVKNRADIFFCPKENYKEAKEEKEKNNYNIKIYGVSTFNEALEILKRI